MMLEPVSGVPLIPRAERPGCGSLDLVGMEGFRKRALEIIRKASDPHRCLDLMRMKANDFLGVDIAGGGTGVLRHLQARSQDAAPGDGSDAVPTARDRGEDWMQGYSYPQQGSLHSQANVQFSYGDLSVREREVRVRVSFDKITMAEPSLSALIHGATKICTPCSGGVGAWAETLGRRKCLNREPPEEFNGVCFTGVKLYLGGFPPPMIEDYGAATKGKSCLQHEVSKSSKARAKGRSLIFSCRTAKGANQILIVKEGNMPFLCNTGMRSSRTALSFGWKAPLQSESVLGRIMFAKQEGVAGCLECSQGKDEITALMPFVDMIFGGKLKRGKTEKCAVKVKKIADPIEQTESLHTVDMIPALHDLSTLAESHAGDMDMLAADSILGKRAVVEQVVGQPNMEKALVPFEETPLQGGDMKSGGWRWKEGKQGVKQGIRLHWKQPARGLPVT